MCLDAEVLQLLVNDATVLKVTFIGTLLGKLAKALLKCYFQLLIRCGHGSNLQVIDMAWQNEF